MKTTAGAVAAELRKLADALDREPEAEIEPLSIHASHYGATKPQFLNLVRLLPGRLEKVWGEMELKVKWGDPFEVPVALTAYIQRSEVCQLIEPAKPAVYKCEPLLSDEEEAGLLAEPEQGTVAA